VPGFGERGNPPAGGRGLRPSLGLNWYVEIAIIPESVSGSFASLRRNLIVGVSASFALMAALVLLAVRFPYYLRSQQIERELNLARRVQADLLPSAESISPYVDFSAECISAWQVGGDFCDVFHVPEDRSALVLGDVSGKGISAALLMALIHGAIHSVSWTRSTQDHVTASRQLNTLLCQKTASERFTSLFWGYFDPQRSTIQYINAGHLPPLLLRKTQNELEIHKRNSLRPATFSWPSLTASWKRRTLQVKNLAISAFLRPLRICGMPPPQIFAMRSTCVSRLSPEIHQSATTRP
jgi:stage II sporulation SpoE-like protein